MNLKPLVIMAIMIGILGDVTMTPNIFPDKTGAWGKVKSIQLPGPVVKGKISLEEAIKKRRSRRRFEDKPLNLKQVSQVLWAAQGITKEGGFKRAAPSAGALYPLEIYLVVKKVEGLEPGVYHYNPAHHTIVLTLKGDYQNSLARACLDQMFIANAPLCIVITAEYERTTIKYGERGIRYVHMEAGHVGQNICLETVALGLGTVPVGAFRDDKISKMLNLPTECKPLYVFPIGYAK